MAIYIKEISPPRKLSGLSSLLITFDYNPQIVQTIKTLDTYIYHKADYAWEIPANQLARALDILTFYDKIQLQLLPDKVEDTKNNSLTDTEIKSFKYKPYNHQIDGINFGLAHNKWLLLDQPGLGKTNQIAWLAETLKARGLIEHCLIICGVNALKKNWQKELNIYSKESSIIIGERKTKRGTDTKTSIEYRAKQLLEPIDKFFIIINIESLRSDKIINAFKKTKNKIDMIAFDECHMASKQSQQGNGLLKLDAKYKIAATGTPIVNSPLSAFLALSWTDNDHATLTNYKHQYCRFGGFNNSQILGYQNLDLLKEELDSCSIRRTKDMLTDLPPKTITAELIEMEPDHASFYDAIKQGVKEEADLVDLKAGNLLALTTRLRQASVCPAILTSQNIVSSKIKRCIELAEDLVEQGEKVVIMSTFKPPVYQLAEALKQYNPLINTGDQSDFEISNNVKQFQEDQNTLIFIGTTSRCATGLTLNAAAYMICLDSAWTSALNNQCWDRIHRANNTRPAFITVLLCKDTIDERVWQVASDKQDLSDYLIDDVDNQFKQDGDYFNFTQSIAKDMYNIITNLD